VKQIMRAGLAAMALAALSLSAASAAAEDPDRMACDAAVFDIAPSGLEACQRMVQKLPNDTYWRVNLIGALAARRKTDEAQAELDKALAMAPNAQVRAEIESAAADILSATSGR
jgi:hypothetical protein